MLRRRGVTVSNVGCHAFVHLRLADGSDRLVHSQRTWKQQSME